MRSTPRAAATAAILACALTLAACGTKSSPSSGGSGSGSGKTYQIGITQIVTHPSLDEARAGFKKALQDAGINASYDEQNAQG